MLALCAQIGQLYRIFEVLGTPTDHTWAGVTNLPDWQARFPQWPAQDLAQVTSPPAFLKLSGSRSRATAAYICPRNVYMFLCVHECMYVYVCSIVQYHGVPTIARNK